MSTSDVCKGAPARNCQPYDMGGPGVDWSGRPVHDTFTAMLRVLAGERAPLPAELPGRRCRSTYSDHDIGLARFEREHRDAAVWARVVCDIRGVPSNLTRALGQRADL